MEDLKFIATFSQAVPNPYILGGKGTNLVKLSQLKLNVPTGFIVLTNSYMTFLNEVKNIGNLMNSIDIGIKAKEISNYSKEIKNSFLNTPLPERMVNEITEAYEKIYNRLGGKPSFAVRSSATIEDLSKFSYAGQAETFLYNNSIEDILESVKNCYLSLFSPHALLYFLKIKEKGFKKSLTDIQMAVVIQRMVDSDISGVLFTVNVINNNRNEMMINSTYGLGETLTNNTVNPDTIILRKEKFIIINSIIGKKEKMAIKNPEGSHTTLIDTEPNLREVCSLNEEQLHQLFKLGIKLEDEFNCPQDIEWAFDHDVLYTLQARPITTLKKEE